MRISFTPFPTSPEPRMHLQIVIDGTRPHRAGEPQARWLAARPATGGFSSHELVDLADVALPGDSPLRGSLLKTRNFLQQPGLAVSGRFARKR